MAQIIVGGIFNAVAFSAAGFLFSKLNHQGYEVKWHNNALELLAKSKEEFYEQQVKRKNRMDELRIEIANARISEQQTDKAFVLLNREYNRLKAEENNHPPQLSDFYIPSKEMHKYQSLSAIIIKGVIGFTGYKVYEFSVK